MVSSQDNAVAAALRALDIPFKTAVKVSEVDQGRSGRRQAEGRATRCSP